MNSIIAVLLIQDGLTSGAIYALRALALLIAHALPPALAKAEPGKREFRSALRDMIETTANFHAMTGIFSYAPDDHARLAPSAAVYLSRHAIPLMRAKNAGASG